jgi:lysozyme
MLEGIDISRWQGVIDWATVKPHIHFAILKATEGVSYTDPTFLTNKQGCIANGIPHGAYHFFRTNQDPVAQAAHFYDVVGANIKVLVCDVETNDGGDLKANLRTFMQTLEDVCDFRPWVYTAPAFWRAYGIHDEQWCQYHTLWIANYGVDQPYIPPGWNSWKIWQYSDKGVMPGIPGNSVDMNYFNGTEDELMATFGNGLPVELPDKVRVVANVLNVRSKPMGLIVGQVKNGWILGVNGEEIYKGVRWLKIGTAFISSEWTEVVE